MPLLVLIGLDVIMPLSWFIIIIITIIINVFIIIINVFIIIIIIIILCATQ